ncbi:MAG: protein kinase [Pirellulaceae bacterium]
MSATDFVRCLADSGLVPHGEIEKLRDRVASNSGIAEAEMLAEALVKENLLTAYQARVLLAGDSSGLVLGNYTVLDKIGQGGMGRVYKAWHRRMKRVVAIKTLPAELTHDEKAIQRFHREVEVAAQLSHRNIVTAYDADEVSGIHFLVMEFVEGPNLNLLVKELGPFSVIDAMRCVIDAAHGVSFAHRQGIIHRDIKPANLLLDPKGMVRVLDLGLARTQDLSRQTTEAQAELTSEETVVGTADYLAPEQALTPKRADHRVDVYSLGITLYYLLTGKIPYPGDSMLDRLVAHRERPVPSVRDARPEVPVELEAICQKMMAKEPDDRYSTLNDVIRALEKCLDHLVPDLDEAAPIMPPGQHSAIPAPDLLPGMASQDVTMPIGKPRLVRQLLGWSSGALVCCALAGLAWYRLSPAPVVGPSTPPVSLQPVANSPDANPPEPRGTWDESRRQFAAAFPDAPVYDGYVYDAREAARRQTTWAHYLGIPVESESMLGLRLVLIPPGQSCLGTEAAEVEALKQADRESGEPKDWYIVQLGHEAPQRRATSIFPLLVSKYEVSEGLFARVKERRPFEGGDADVDKRPIHTVAWVEAIRFCNELSIQEGLEPCYEIGTSDVLCLAGSGYRLPSEQEWEYICRAGTDSLWHFGDDPRGMDEYGHCNGGSGPMASGLLRPNPWGVHDLYGNVWEWCQDTQPAVEGVPMDIEPLPRRTKLDARRVVRSGNFELPPHLCRSASRTNYRPTYVRDTHGLRIVRELRSRNHSVPERSVARQP